MSTAPVRSMDQRIAALAEANHRRSMRAARKVQWRAGTCAEAWQDLRWLLAAPPEWAATWRLHDVLMALPKFGRVRTRTVLRRAELEPLKPIGTLTTRQCGELEEAVELDYPPSRGKVNTCRCGGRKVHGSAQCWMCRNGHPYPGRRPA